MTGIIQQRRNRFRTRQVLFLLVALVVFIAALPTFGQNRNAGEIRGTVLDSSGAAVPGVKVVVTNVATGIVTTTTTGDAGVYDIPWVETGTYTVTFTKEGFQQVVQNNIDLHLGAITVDATMQVGSVATKITVTSKTDQLQSATSEKSLVMEPLQLTQLPLVGNDVWSYALLIPGVNPGEGGAGNFSNGANVGINGSQSTMGSWVMDGGTMTLPGGNNSVQVPTEAIGELNIIASNAGAEYGNGMSVMQVMTKSGTNQFHGSAFEYVQNNVFNARNFFSPTVAPERWNEFGGSVGGPIKKDKAFFFFAYQRNPTVAYSPSFYTYPTASMREGNFSGGGFPTLYDPSTTTLNGGVYTRTAFNGNIISPIDAVSAAIDKYYPMPQTSALYNNYFVNDKDPETSTWYNFKVDYNISQKQRLVFSGQVEKDFTVQNAPDAPINVLDIWGGRAHFSN